MRCSPGRPRHGPMPSRSWMASARYTYREVDAASNRFARFLIGQGLRPEEPVAIMLESAFELVVALLGTLKAGGAMCR